MEGGELGEKVWAAISIWTHQAESFTLLDLLSWGASGRVKTTSTNRPGWASRALAWVANNPEEGRSGPPTAAPAFAQESLESALMGTHQELEMFGSQPAYPEKLLHKKESLQNQLINIRVELSQATTVGNHGNQSLPGEPSLSSPPLPAGLPKSQFSPESQSRVLLGRDTNKDQNSALQRDSR